MKLQKLHRLGDLQLQIMKVLWERAEASVSDVHKALGAKLAYVTVASMLRQMEGRGLVRHRVEGRTFIYQPLVAESEVTRGMVGYLVDQLFSGSLPAMVSHLLTSREISAEELKSLEKIIAERKARK